MAVVGDSDRACDDLALISRLIPTLRYLSSCFRSQRFISHELLSVSRVLQ